MKFLGVLLIIASVFCLFGGYIVYGLIVLTLGFLSCVFSSYLKEKRAAEAKAKAEQEEKEDWIIKRTKKYIEQDNMAPADAKIKAEVDYASKKFYE